MIQKLRVKFVLINMALVLLVLLIVFGSLCFSNYQRMKNDSTEAMLRVVSHLGSDAAPSQQMPPTGENGQRKPNEKRFAFSPVFCVTLNSDNQAGTVTSENMDVTDETAQAAVQAALATEKNNGILSGLSLRFLKTVTKSGETVLAFADRSSEISSMGNLLLTSLPVGLGGLAAFFLISLFLSGWALRPVEKTWRQQRQFVADASHELKTPLTVILANTGILLAHEQDTIATQKKWIDYIQAEAARMKLLVEDMLFLAKSDSTEKRTQHTAAALSDIVWSSLLPFESVAYEAGIDLTSSISPGLMVRGDEGQLKQLVAILMDNACKYAGKAGTVMLRLTAKQGKAVLSVQNSGAPIPAKDLAHIFERFYRTDKSRARAQGGYGLGLAIAKSIVDSHCGRISVASSAQAGTVFTVTLDLHP